ncbi:MAG TPA: hypothetical protein DHU69_08380 [Deltaproteobacteria bacterium]|nr:MAG: hypothetical protein A2067_04415 [Deltaproteobacteria bacterium GWB2_42_7]OGP47278.1 MAG: hypothetical protein A2022_09505 [Deltaproteobacteria bacterium GWF2_42_12]OGQ25184.1 MAG: hypothetical protein A3D29_06915 [Deltaproteobacteria bacterium RIFCSPHIGHO2_02_FULL_42_44]OGQ68850.1 MAG: hypothetical protein A3F88_05170 [Deltaproteobacteria bacterium RIFCSPLOWO2_12_FULL_42_16]OGQ76634.1 MAG: hypothetical protein A2235_10365 [Deltaproteobacteria bacterium RIFOXYA2_FULL_42_10]HAG49741.1 h
MANHRRFKRQYIIAEAKIRTLKKDNLWINAMLINISKGGIGLYLKKSLKTGEKVAVKIAFLRNDKIRIVEEMPGIIKWARQIGNNYAAGIMFDEAINKKTTPRLWNCLEYARHDK